MPARTTGPIEHAVVLCADRRYFPPAYVVCSELARGAARGGYAVHLLTEPGPHLDRVPPDVPFAIATPDTSRLPDDPAIYSAWPSFALLRLLVPDILPGYRRILYLDCDVRIEGSIASLLALDMRGKAVAAVDEDTSYRTYADPSKNAALAEARQRIGLDVREPYFNSGMLLIDAQRWKNEGTSTALLDCVSRFGKQLLHPDQDSLNIVFRNAWLALSPRWNFIDTYFGSELEDLLRPVVYHNLSKPWNFGQARRREVRMFRQSLSRTPFADFLPAFPSYRALKRHIETRGKIAIQRVTPFLGSSATRNRERSRKRRLHALARHLIRSVEGRRFADVEQNITAIDLKPLRAMLGEAGASALQSGDPDFKIVRSS